MPALDHRLIRLKALPDGFQAEFIETAERGQTGRGEDSVEHVEVFRMVERLPANTPDYTLNCEEPVNLQEAPLRGTGLSPDAQEFAVEMPGIAYTLSRCHHLDLQVSTTSLMHATARTPAHVEVEATVEVPVR